MCGVPTVRDDETDCTCGVVKSVDEFVTIRYPNISNVKVTVDVSEGLAKGLTLRQSCVAGHQHESVP